MAACVAVAASAHAQTGDWGDLAVVSGTLGNNANRLCLGVPASMRPADIGCPVYAPYVSAPSGFVGLGTSAPSSSLHLLGSSPNITLHNPNGSADFKTEILQTYDASQCLKIRNRGSTVLNYACGSTVNALGLYTSNTQQLTIINSGNVGIGTTVPSTTLHVSGTLRISNGGEACDANRAGAIRYTSSSVFQFCMGSGWQNLADAAGGGQADRITSGTTSVIATQDRSVTISTAGTQRVVVGEDGNVGIGTVAPTRLLTLSGAQNTSGISLTETTYGGQLSLEPRGYTTGEYQIRMTGPATQGIGFKVGGGGTAFIDYDGTRFTVQPAQGAFSTGAWNTRVYGQLAVDSTASASFTAVSVTANSGQIADIVNITKSGGLPLLKVNKNGNVGIGTSVPSTTLHVSGSVRIADGGEACDASRIGTIRYNADAQAFQMCRP